MLTRPSPRSSQRTRDCEEVHARLSDYLDGELEAKEKEEVEEHLGLCPPCRRVFSGFRETLRRLQALAERTPPGADKADDVAARVAAFWRERR